MPANPSRRDEDFYAWSLEQAALLRERRLAEADLDLIAEEIESMGKTEKRELVSRLTVLLLHLLKWRFQPRGRGNFGASRSPTRATKSPPSLPTIQASSPLSMTS